MPVTAPTDGLNDRLVAATLRCVARWGVAKTSFDDIAREAGVSRATAYRAFPGGRERLFEAVAQDEVARFFREVDAVLAGADDLADMLTRGISRALAEIADHPALATLLRHEPERVLPHVAFHRLDRFLATTTALARPHLARFLPDDAIAPTAEWAARIVITYSIHPASAVDPHDPDSVRHLVDTYVLPALIPRRPQEPR
jgi:AcrR family transcriptional regulator